MRLFSPLLAGMVALSGDLAAAPTPSPVTAVDSIDINRYAGRWHEIARLPMRFENACDRDITATYSLRADGSVQVRNACTQKDGRQRSADGVARRRDEARAPAELQVRFAPAWLGWLPWVWADYWVIALDPQYRWAMVGEPGRRYLWILSREPTLDRACFHMLKTRAREMGYDLAPLIIAGRIEG